MKEQFLNLRNDIFYGKVFQKLNAEEISFCRIFIDISKDLDFNQRAHAINRVFLDMENKPKHWSDMCELLDIANQRNNSKT